MRVATPNQTSSCCLLARSANEVHRNHLSWNWVIGETANFKGSKNNAAWQGSYLYVVPKQVKLLLKQKNGANILIGQPFKKKKRLLVCCGNYIGSMHVINIYICIPAFTMKINQNVGNICRTWILWECFVYIGKALITRDGKHRSGCIHLTNLDLSENGQSRGDMVVIYKKSFLQGGPPTSCK